MLSRLPEFPASALSGSCDLTDCRARPGSCRSEAGGPSGRSASVPGEPGPGGRALHHRTFIMAWNNKILESHVHCTVYTMLQLCYCTRTLYTVQYNVRTYMYICRALGSYCSEIIEFIELFSADVLVITKLLTTKSGVH